MLKSLKVKGFRSLYDTSLVFSPTGLTAVIGANGCGKSNLIKCLEFVSKISRDGLDSTIRTFNGAEAIVPKKIPKNSIQSTRVEIEYVVESSFGRDPRASLPIPSARHHLVLEAKSEFTFDVIQEVLEFTQPLIAFYLQNTKTRGRPRQLSALPSEVPPSWRDSKIRLMRRPSGVLIDFTPQVEASNLDGYLGWLGMPFLKQTLEKQRPEDFLQTIQGLIASQFAAVESKRIWSMIESQRASLLGFSPFFSTLREEVGSIRRYDFQLAELRRQQDIAASQQLMPDGRGMPSAVRNIQESEEKAWQRVKATLEEIAPHIADAGVSALSSGQEFVHFIENKTGRNVESWQSSDGTLRALAILLAIETHPKRGVMLVEEPEQGLHPWAVRVLLEHIRQAIGRRGVQTIITTHSQQVLDVLESSEVVVAKRDRKNGTVLQPLEEIAETGRLGKGDIGRAWVKGLLGGIPEL